MRKKKLTHSCDGQNSDFILWMRSKNEEMYSITFDSRKIS